MLKCYPFLNYTGTRVGYGYNASYYMLAELKAPGHSGTRLLDEYPSVQRVPAVEQVPGYLPKMDENTRKYPGMYSSNLASTRFRRVLVV